MISHDILEDVFFMQTIKGFFPLEKGIGKIKPNIGFFFNHYYLPINFRSIAYTEMRPTSVPH